MKGTFMIGAIKEVDVIGPQVAQEGCSSLFIVSLLPCLGVILITRRIHT